jgi:hypothetical protein
MRSKCLLCRRFYFPIQTIISLHITITTYTNRLETTTHVRQCIAKRFNHRIYRVYATYHKISSIFLHFSKPFFNKLVHL